MFFKIQSFLEHFSSETIFVERELKSPSIRTAEVRRYSHARGCEGKQPRSHLDQP